MAGRIYMKRNDLLPVVDATLCDRNGPVNLTGATVNFIMKSAAGVLKFSSPATIMDAANGVVRYTWVLGNTDTAGAFRGEFQVSFPGGAFETFPNDEYIPTIITEDLA